MQDMEYEGAKRLRKENEKFDRISWLPEHIIHEILDRLPSKDVARTSILSKTWKCFTNSYPILHLDHNLFGLKCLLAAGKGNPDICEIREEFVSFAKYHLSKVIHHKITLRRLALIVAIDDDSKSLDQLMDLVCNLNKVEELCLFVQTNDYTNMSLLFLFDYKRLRQLMNMVCYNIPSSVLTLNGLRSLHVIGCKFGTVAANHFSALQRLSLSNVTLEEEGLINLTLYCPGIEILEFEHCTFWDESLELSVFPRLKEVSILNNHGNLNIITIDKDGLESFKCNFDTRCEFIPTACRSIRELTVSRCTISPPNLFVELTTNFPLIEEVEVSHLGGLSFTERFKVASHHLRKLSIPFKREDPVNHISIDCPNLEYFKLEVYGLKEVYFNCPNLRQLFYIGNNAIPALPLFNTSTALKVIHFQVIENPTYLDSLWFMHLRGVIKQMDQVGRAIHLNLGFCPKMVVFKPLEYGAFLASLQSNVHLRIGIFPAVKLIFKNSAGFVDGLIWSTCPTTLTFVGICDEYLEDFCEKLVKKPRNKSCGEFCNKCWWHYIVDFEVESLLTIKDVKKNLPAFMKMYKKYPYKKYLVRPMCTFKLYWRCNKGCQDAQ